MVKPLVQGLTASKRPSWDSNPSLSASKASALACLTTPPLYMLRAVLGLCYCNVTISIRWNAGIKAQPARSKQDWAIGTAPGLFRVFRLSQD